MRLSDKLLNPFALVGQGFVLGGVLFFATSHADCALTRHSGVGGIRRDRPGFGRFLADFRDFRRDDAGACGAMSCQKIGPI
jgi:hypothetical protein